MSLLRLAGRWSALAVVLLSTLATAAAPAAVCAAPTASAPAPEATSSWGAVCFESLCNTDTDCWNACPGASSASCENSVCKYSTPGGGGGGGGGPYCEARLCMSDWDCACGSRGGYCDANSTCQYY